MVSDGLTGNYSFLLTCYVGSSLVMKDLYTIPMLLTIPRYDRQRKREQRKEKGQDYDVKMKSSIVLHDYHRNIYHTIEAMNWT